MNGLPMSPQEVTRRLRDLSELSVLRVANRLDGKVDLSVAAVERRLRRQAMLTSACRRWTDLGKDLAGPRPRGR